METNKNINRVFIVRPFGEKLKVDFNKVDELLIQPALKGVGIIGSTTASIVEQGNIREDMFAQLLLADLVIADISIHNANVFYELGIRHALRDKRTFLIRCSVPEQDVPFDLKTDRYLSYESSNPAAAVDNLIAGLKATLLSDKADSPVFYMLPKLEAQDPERFLAVPSDFGEEVNLACASKQVGKLALLANEVEGFPWTMPAMRQLGEALFDVKDFEASAIAWQRIRDRYPNDLEANDRLATIFQRQAEEILLTNPEGGWQLLEKSDQAIKRQLLNHDKIDDNKRAEIYALQGRNAKTRWIDTWRKDPASEYSLKALKSTYLLDAYQFYEKAFDEDLNHYYSGINALALLTVMISLAGKLPDTFALEYDDDDAAQEALKKYKNRQKELCLLVQCSINAKRKRSKDTPDEWLDVTEADLCCLTSTRPLRVAGLYQKILQQANQFTADSARRQLELYAQLEVLTENVSPALKEFQSLAATAVSVKKHYLLFTGHMIDKPDRTAPRFPPAIEADVRAAIKKEVEQQLTKYGDRLLGISGGACGGDIIFHEVCRELGIKTELYLLLPSQQYIVESVQFGGVNWQDRFYELFTHLPGKVLAESKELPKWLQTKPNYSIWERNNLWMLHSGLACGGVNLTLVALWDGKGGDGPGGTGHMVSEAKSRGAKTIVIDINQWN